MASNNIITNDYNSKLTFIMLKYMLDNVMHYWLILLKNSQERYS